MPCKQGESVSINFFDYTVFGARCFYCEVDANGVATTAPVQYATNQNVLTLQTFTITQSNSIGFVIEWYITSTQERNYTKENYMVVRGTTPPTAYMPYGQIYTDGTVETINVHGKNLFKSANWGAWYPSTSGTIDRDGTNRSVVIRCLPNTKYYFKHCTYRGGLRAFYTEEENWDVGSPCSYTGAVVGDANVVYSITTSANAKWLFACFGRTDSSTTATYAQQASDYMLSIEELTSATEYEPYFDGGTATAEMLLKVGDYQDEQEILSGVVTRNVKVLVLSGTEDSWRDDGTSGQNSHSFRLELEQSAVSVSSVISQSFCTHIDKIFRSSAATQTERPCIRFHLQGKYIYFYTVDNTTTLETFQQWLADQYAAGTPVIVVYPLAEPTTESVTGQTLQVQDGDNVLEITQAGMDGLELEAEYTKVE